MTTQEKIEVITSYGYRVEGQKGTFDGSDPLDDPKEGWHVTGGEAVLDETVETIGITTSG